MCPLKERNLVGSYPLAPGKGSRQVHINPEDPRMNLKTIYVAYESFSGEYTREKGDGGKVYDQEKRKWIYIHVGEEVKIGDTAFVGTKD